MRRICVLIVDDEEVTRETLRATLRAEGYETLEARDGVEALRTIEREAPDLLILDIVMPQLDGLEVLRRLRQHSEIPIIVLSARGGMADKVKCLNLGADDYITKPFSVDELIARFRAVLRRTKTAGSVPVRPCFVSGNLRIDFVTRQVTVTGKEVRLTPTEYNLLQELVLNEGRVLTYSHLLSKVWGAEYETEKEYVHTYIRHLRSKVESDPKNPQNILSMAGVGHLFRNTEEHTRKQRPSQ
jgi:two-component system KDP operon response regulator KdpE